MESVSSVNSNMHNKPLNVGVIYPPDEHFKPILYSDRSATMSFNLLNNDIYQSAQKNKKLNEKKMPLSPFFLLGLAALAIAFPKIKKYIR